MFGLGRQNFVNVVMDTVNDIILQYCNKITKTYIVTSDLHCLVQKKKQTKKQPRLLYGLYYQLWCVVHQLVYGFIN